MLGYWWLYGIWGGMEWDLHRDCGVGILARMGVSMGDDVLFGVMAGQHHDSSDCGA